MASIQERLSYRVTIRLDSAQNRTRTSQDRKQAQAWEREEIAAVKREGLTLMAPPSQWRTIVRHRVQVRLKGFPVQSATFDRKTDAKKWAQDTESAIRDGRHFKVAEAKRHTLTEMIERYIREKVTSEELSEGEKRARTQQLGWWNKQLGPRLLSDVSTAAIVEARDRLGQGTAMNGPAS